MQHFYRIQRQIEIPILPLPCLCSNLYVECGYIPAVFVERIHHSLPGATLILACQNLRSNEGPPRQT